MKIKINEKDLRKYVRKIMKETILEASPSTGLSKKQKSATAKKAKSGGDIGKKGKGFAKVAKAAGGGEKGQKIAAAAMWKNIKREDVNELSPELVKKARHQAYKGAKEHEYGRKAYNMGNDTIGDYQAGPIEKKLEKQVDTFRKGEEQRKGHPFYDPKHPEYQQHSKKGGKVHPDYKLTNLIQPGFDPHQEGKDDVKELGATLKTLGGIAKAVGQGAKAVGKGAKDVVKKALEPAGEPHWDKSG